MAHAAEAGTFRGDWVRFIYGTARITDSTRVLMLALSEAMDESGRVEAARDEVANLLSRAPRRVSSRYTDAIDAGVLEQVSRGNRKTGSVFQALIPNGEHVTHGGHMFPRKHVTESRPLSQETSDPRGAHASEETGDGRGSPRDPNTCPPGVTSSGPPIREGFSGSSPQPMFDIPKPKEPKPAQSSTRTYNQRVNALAKVYYDATNRMGDWDKIRSVIKKAHKSEYTDEQIHRGLAEVAREGRFTLTADTLRIAINRTGPQEPAPGSMASQRTADRCSEHSLALPCSSCLADIRAGDAEVPRRLLAEHGPEARPDLAQHLNHGAAA